MAHFAQLNESNTVIQVVVVANEELLENGIESESKGIEFCYSLFGGNWIQTSFNARIRKNYAGIGFTYDADQDAFIAPKPFDNWILINWEWVPPIPMPQDTYFYGWNQETTTWDRGVSRPVIQTSIPYPDDGNQYYWDGLSGSWKPRTTVQHL